MKDLSTLIELAPTNPVGYINRANAWVDVFVFFPKRKLLLTFILITFEDGRTD